MSWSAERAEEHLLGLELFGMRFGLERMRRLLTALGSPHQAFRAIHVVGTNGKSSTTRFAAAMLEAHGVRAGAYLSPHLQTFAERIRIGDADAAPGVFGAAVERAAEAARKVERGFEDDPVTQFELLTAAAFWALADAGVEVAAVEAGLGGRWDATNVLDAPVVVLTSVGLEHTRWLGPTVADIAREKLAVVRDGATLVYGALPAEAMDEVRAVAARRVPVTVPLGAALPGYQRTNAALAAAAVQALLGSVDERKILGAAETVAVPGRFQTVGTDPLTILDGAHNPAGMIALADALPNAIGARPLVAVISILDDKDAAAMLRALLPLCAGAVFTASQNPRALSPATLASLAGQLGWDGDAVIEREPRRALDLARTTAGSAGAVVATGSIYLVADLLREPGDRRRVSAL